MKDLPKAAYGTSDARVHDARRIERVLRRGDRFAKQVGPLRAT
jgi:hypothetical protein